MRRSRPFNLSQALMYCSHSLLLIATPAFSQIDSSASLNMDAVYDRPFLQSEKLPVSLGGYIEANSEFKQTDGVNDGLSFQLPRLTLFVASSITQRIQFLTELELEEGGEELAIEYAALDVMFHPLLAMRGGILVNPIGSFNQNHDGPRWDFVNRPISSTTLIPATLSTVGFGMYGKHSGNNWILGYEGYLTNEKNRTSLSDGLENANRFEENESGIPMFTGKFSVRNLQIGEVGISYLTGVYNKWKADGNLISEKRNASIASLDFNTSLLNNRLEIVAEGALISVEVPETYSQQFGKRQAGFFTDVVCTVVKRRMLGWDDSRFNTGIRLEYVDYNVGKFTETPSNIADDVYAVVPALAFRPGSSTVLRLNYRYEIHQDLFGNPPSRAGAIQFGFSTYF
jgi:hypothetical protein